MKDSHDHEKKANLYASRRSNKLGGNLAQTEFGVRIEMKSVTSSILEVGQVRFARGRAVANAQALCVSLTTSILQNEEGHVHSPSGNAELAMNAGKETTTA